MKEGPRLAGPVAIAALYVVALGALAVWLGLSESFDLKRQLAALTPYGLHLCFLVLLGAGWAARGAIARSLQGSGTAPYLLAAGAWVAVATLPPRTHRIFYDEDIYENVAQNILWRDRAEMCNEGVIAHDTFQCFGGEYNKEPSAFPFLLSVVFRFTGVEEAAAHVLNHALFVLGVLCAFWIGRMLFRDRRASIAAGLLYLLTPENLLWGATVAVEPGAAAFAGLGLGAWLLFLEEPGLATSLLAAAALAFAVQWRPESVLLLPLAGLATLALAPRLVKDRRVWVAGLIILVLLLPHFAHLWAVRGEGWGSPEGEKFAWRHVPENLKANALFHVEGKEYPVYFTLLGLLGLLAPGRWRGKLVALGWFVFFFGIFIPFHAGSYRYGADVRFSLASSMPLALIGAAGAAWVSSRLSIRARGSRWLPSLPLVAAGYFFTGYLPLVRAVGREAWEARADHEAARDMLAHVPEGSIILTHNPGMVQVMGASAVQASIATYQPARVDEFFRIYPGGVYFHFNFWCNVSDPVQNAFCTHILATYPAEVLLERSAGTYRYVLYRLMPKRSEAGPSARQIPPGV